MKLKLVLAVIVSLVISCSMGFAGQSKTEQKKPGNIEVIEITLEAVVEAVDHDARKVTLKDANGETVTIDVKQEVENLPQVEVGDVVEVKYIESVAIQVFAADQAETGTDTIAAGKSAKPGEKPAAVAIKELFEETGLPLDESKLISLHPKPLYSSPGASEEKIWFFGTSVKVTQDEFDDLQGRVTGAEEENEFIVTRLVTKGDFVKLNVSAQALLAVHLFDDKFIR